VFDELGFRVLQGNWVNNGSVKQKANTAWSQNSLLHWETLLIATTLDLENVSFELLAQSISTDFLRDSLVVKRT
jgi:hypothetical protein